MELKITTRVTGTNYIFSPGWRTTELRFQMGNLEGQPEDLLFITGARVLSLNGEGEEISEVRLPEGLTALEYLRIFDELVYELQREVRPG